jgi:diaminopimelate decarboxylase
MINSLPFNKEQIEKIALKYPTPFYIYDEHGFKLAARELKQAFAWNKGFKEFFAVKATPNPAILASLKLEGLGADCSSLAELVLAEKVGVVGEEIMFSSNNTPLEEYAYAKKLGAIINLDDLTQLEYIEQIGLPEIISFRYNPGSEFFGGNELIGKPEESKFGLTKEQLLKAYHLAAEKGVKRFGLHTMLASNELNPDSFTKTARMLFELAVELDKTGIKLEFVNLGGGIGIPYRPEQQKLDILSLGEEIRKIYEEIITANKLEVKLFMECGRVITGPHGYLVTKVLHHKDIYKHYVGVDANMANLMRPAMYNAYHHITVLGKNNVSDLVTCDVVGSLCENNDKFAIDRQLPKVERGDILVIHDAGAHSHAMGFNYNGKLRSAEFLLNEDNKFELIRRAETLDDLFSTIQWDKQVIN